MVNQELIFLVNKSPVFVVNETSSNAVNGFATFMVSKPLKPRYGPPILHN
jgi:hypothetical protein